MQEDSDRVTGDGQSLHPTRRALCAHLDSARSLVNGQLYLWELLMARAYVGIPVLTDSMLLDTAAVRACISDGSGCGVLQGLATSGNIVCLRRPAKSFFEALVKMLRAGPLFSSLTPSQNAAVREQLMCASKMSDDEVFNAFISAIGDTGYSYTQLIKTLDNIYGQGSIENWPRPDQLRMPYAQHVLQEISNLEAVDSGSLVETDGHAIELRRHLDQQIAGGKDVLRGKMYELLGYNRGIPLKFAEARCKEIVDREYSYRFPDALGYRCIHINDYVGKVLPRRTSSFIDDLCISAIGYEAKLPEMRPELKDIMFPGEVLEALVEHTCASSFVPLSDRLLGTRDPKEAVTAFNYEISDVVLKAVKHTPYIKRPSDSEACTRMAIYQGEGSILGGVVATVAVSSGLLSSTSAMESFAYVLGGMKMGETAGRAAGWLQSFVWPLMQEKGGRMFSHVEGRAKLRALFPSYARLLRGERAIPDANEPKEIS